MSTCVFLSVGRPKYKFASFWSRNRTLRALQQAFDNFDGMQAIAKQVKYLQHFLCLILTGNWMMTLVHIPGKYLQRVLDILCGSRFNLHITGLLWFHLFLVFCETFPLKEWQGKSIPILMRLFCCNENCRSKSFHGQGNKDHSTL